MLERSDELTEPSVVDVAGFVVDDAGERLAVWVVCVCRSLFGTGTGSGGLDVALNVGLGPDVSGCSSGDGNTAR